MKRQHEVEEFPDSEENGRRTRARLEDGNLGAGNLDLNAAPIGFDLNAPISEELESLGQPSWMLEAGNDGQRADQIARKDVVHFSDLHSGETGGRENTEFQIDVTRKLAGSEEEDEKVLQPSAEIGVREALENCGGETQTNSLEQCTSSVTAAISHRPLESVVALGINEELDILSSIWNAYEHGDVEALDTILAEACEELAKSPLGPSKYHYLTCVYISKKLPEVFSLQKTFKILLTFFCLTNSQIAAKRQTLLPVFASKLLLRAFEPAPRWPLDFVRVFLEDAIGFRSWIDQDGCKEFVANILTAFCDGEANRMLDDLSQPRPQGSPGGSEGQKSRKDAGVVNHSDIVIGSTVGLSALKSRYSSTEMRRAVRKEFLEALHHLLSLPSTKENPRQLIKLLMQGAGYEEVRVIGSSMLESWLNNPVHLRTAKALLDRIVEQLCGLSENDITTVANLLALRVPSVQAAGQMKSLHGNIYTEMMTHIVRQRPEYASLALKTFVIAEINGKHLSNLKNIATLLKVLPVSPPPEQELALVLQDQAVHEENRGQLREFIRRLMKHIGQELNIQALCHGLLQPWPAMAEQAESLKDGWLTQLVDLTCQLLLHGIAPIACDESFTQACKALPTGAVTMSEAFASFSHEKFLLLEKFSLDMAAFQTEAMEWCTNVLVNYLPTVTSGRFKSIVQKFLFLEDPQTFLGNGDNLNDGESNSFQLLGFCTRASEEVLARLILMGISTGYPLTQAEALEIIGKLVWRAAGVHRQMHGALEAESTQLPVAILKLASLHLPGVGRQAPLLVFKDLYWRACLIVLLITVNNVSKLGKYVWENIPTVRSMLEGLLTCSKDFLPISCDEAERKEVERQELEAMERDAKAEEAIAAFMLEKRRAEEGTTGMCVEDAPGSSAISPQNNEWKKNIMYLDHTNNSRKPPPTVIKDIDRAEELYQLGQILRKCKNPDFFVEVTTSQALPRAWLWLRKVLTHEPELVTRLPLLWQVELLYLYEELHPTNQKYFMDLSCLYESLNKAVTQEPTGKENEIDSIMEFLSKKLASTHCVVRSKARRCFSGIFNSSLSKETVTSKSEQGPVLGYASVRNEDLGWLDVFDFISKGSGLLNTICPAICKAIHQETSVEVVLAYFTFLRKHSSPLSVACSAAFLAMNRKLLIATLLHRSSNSFISGRDAFRSFVQAHQSVADLFLETFKEALEAGLIPFGLNTEFTDLFLISPYYQSDKKEIGFSRISTQKIIVDASIHVITLVSSEANEPLKENSSYERIIQILFPGFVNPTENVRMKPFCMAWLEVNAGNQLPLLSEDQAQALSRSKDVRLVQAGLFALDKEAKMELCTRLGLLSSACTESLLKDLAGFNIRTIQGEGISVSAAKNVQRMQESFALIDVSNTRNREGSENPQYNVLQPCIDNTAKEKFSPAMRFESEKEAPQNSWRESWNSRKISVVEIVQHLIQLSPDRNSLSMYMQIRKILQEINFCCAAENFLVELGPDLEGLVNVKGKCLSESFIFRLHLPILVSLGSLKAVLLHSLSRNPESDSASKFKRILEFSFQSMEDLQKGAIGWGLGFMNENIPQSLTLADHLVKELHELLLEPWQQTDLSHGNCQAVVMEIKSNDGYCQTKSGFTSVDGFLYQRIELDVYKYLQSSLKSVWKEKGATKESRLKDLTKELLIHIEKLDSKIFLSHASENCFVRRTGFTENIARAGLYGLLVGRLKVLDVDVVLEKHVVQLIEVSCIFPRDDDTRKPIIHLYPSVILGWVVHQTSWAYTTKVFKHLMKALKNMINGQNCEPFPTGTSENEAYGMDASLHYGFWKQMLSFGTLMEFVNAILNSPHTRLFRHAHQLQSFSESNVNLMASLLTPLMAKVICVLGIIVSTLCSIFSGSCLEYQPFEMPFAENLQIDKNTMKNHCLKYEKVVVKVLTAIASHDVCVMRTVAHELWDWEQGVDSNFHNNLFLSNATFKHVTKLSAKKLLWRLYISSPLSFESVLQPMRCRELTTSDFSMNMGIFSGEAFSLGQTSKLRALIHQTIISIFRGNAKEVDSSYKFCKMFARQHPSFFLTSIPVLAVLLKELLPLMRAEDIDQRSQFAHALSMGVSLLDALRPYIFWLNNSKQTLLDPQNYRKKTCSSGQEENCLSDRKEQTVLTCDLEPILNVYMDFLQSIESQDAPLFGRVVARLADFLCHCVACGGYCCEFVAAHYTQVLKKAADQFGKIKKLSYLLSLIDSSTSGEKEKIDNARALTATLPIQQVQTVREQLMRSLYVHQVEMPMEQGVNTGGRRNKFWHQKYQNLDDNAEDVDLLATLSDLDQASARLPSILSMLEDVLIDLVPTTDVRISDLVYDLLDRLLSECPSERSPVKIIQALLKQLTTSNASQARTAAKQASRFFFFCPDMQEAILLELFQVSQCAPDHLQQLLQVLLTIGT